MLAYNGLPGQERVAGEASHDWWFRKRSRIGIAFLVAFVPLILLSRPVIGHDSTLDVEFDIVAWITFVAGAAMRFWATLYIGGRKNEMLVVEGPYSVCRNPLYLGNLMLLLSAGLYMKSATFLTGSTLMFLMYLFGVIPSEERTLRERHGPAYDEYCRTTPRLWPRYGQYHARDSMSVSLI